MAAQAIGRQTGVHHVLAHISKQMIAQIGLQQASFGIKYFKKSSRHMQANAKAAYMYAIQQRISQRWVKPPTATAGPTPRRSR